MSRKKFWITLVILMALTIFIKVYSANAYRVEHNYVMEFYPAIASFFRIIFGWLPFSIGDFLYGGAVLWIIIKLIKGIKAVIKKKVTAQSFLNGLKKMVLLVLTIYVTFNIFWGINYNRQGIAMQLNLKKDSVSFDDLKEVTTLLIEKLNASKKYLINNNINYPSNAQLFKKVENAYAKSKQQFSFLTYDNVSVKSSMWGWLGNYTGFTGYYNPFTGEAQVNTTVPKFLQPFVTCHEVAHQLGYAKEDEANSVGYLAALNSGDSLLLYSTYFDLYNYTSRQLFIQSFIRKDTITPKQFSLLLIPEVKADIKEMRDFFQKHRNPFGPLVRKGYGFYLKNNNQPKGMQSYDDVTGFLIAYYKKFGTI